MNWMVVFAMMNKYEWRKMIINMAGYVYFYIKQSVKREQAFVLRHHQVQLFLNLRKLDNHSSHAPFTLNVFLLLISTFFTDHILPLAYLCTSTSPIHHNSTWYVLPLTISLPIAVGINQYVHKRLFYRHNYRYIYTSVIDKIQVRLVIITALYPCVWQVGYPSMYDR